MMMNYNSISVLLALPLAFVLWQGSSCRSSKANSNQTPTMNANASATTPNQGNDLRGTWGGQSISMEVSDEGAAIEFDCARATITQKIAPDRTGQFEAKGTFTREHGGPEREGENNDQPAVFRGSIKDKSMDLRIELTRNNQDLGTFTLTQGSMGRIHKCR